jgi:hypothetical protein
MDLSAHSLNKYRAHSRTGLSEPSLDRYRANSQSPLPSRSGAVGADPMGALRARRHQLESPPAWFGYLATTAGRRARPRRAASRAARPASRAPHRVNLAAVAGRRPGVRAEIAARGPRPEGRRTGRARRSRWRRATAMGSTSSEPPAPPRLPAGRSHGAQPGRAPIMSRSSSAITPARPGDGATVRLLHSAGACRGCATAPGTVETCRGCLAQVGDDLGERFAVAEALLARWQRVAGAGVDVHVVFLPTVGVLLAPAGRLPRGGLPRSWA